MRRDTWLDQLAHELSARAGWPRPTSPGSSSRPKATCARRPPRRWMRSARPPPNATAVVDALEPHVARAPGRTRGISKRYGSQRVLDDVDLDVRDGEAVLPMGANGAGKSTLLRILAGLDAPDGGAVEVGGRVGYAPQDGGLIDQLRPAEHFVLFGRGRGLSREQAIQDG